MIRTKTVTAKQENCRVDITIRVHGKVQTLMRDEIEKIVLALATDAMQSLAGAPYLHVTIPEMEVSKP